MSDPALDITSAILEDLGAPRECVSAARALDTGADALAAAARRVLTVRWREGGRVPAEHVIEAIVAIAGAGARRTLGGSTRSRRAARCGACRWGRRRSISRTRSTPRSDAAAPAPR